MKLSNISLLLLAVFSSCLISVDARSRGGSRGGSRFSRSRGSRSGSSGIRTTSRISSGSSFRSGIRTISSRFTSSNGYRSANRFVSTNGIYRYGSYYGTRFGSSIRSIWLIKKYKSYLLENASELILNRENILASWNRLHRKTISQLLFKTII